MAPEPERDRDQHECHDYQAERHDHHGSGTALIGQSCGVEICDGPDQRVGEGVDNCHRGRKERVHNTSLTDECSNPNQRHHIAVEILRHLKA